MPVKAQIALLKLPQLQLEILHDRLSAEPDLAIVETAGDLSVSETVEQTGAEFVIVGAGRFAEGEVTALLERTPRVKVIVVSASGRDGLLYELRPHRVPIGDLTSGALVEAIRSLRRSTWTEPRNSPREHVTNGDWR